MSDVGFVFANISYIRHPTSDIRHSPQLPLDPPVLIGFFVTPTALAPGLAMNLEACAAFFGPLAPALPPFLLFTGNPMIIGFYQIY
jgi:hypothetical protein